MKRLLLIGLFLANVSNSFAGKEFDIYPVIQDQTLWCWAACCEMVHDAYKVYTYGSYGSGDQYDVADWAVNGQNALNDIYGTSKSVDRVLWHFGSIGTDYDLSTLWENYITREIDDGRPILAGIDLGGIGHVVVIKGYTGSGGFNVGNVIFNDPRPGTGRRELPYDDFAGEDGTSWKWNETLRLTSNPREPIPLGIGPSHRVRLQEYACTTEITQSPQSLSYRAYKSGDSPVSWEWKLIFPHSYGEAVVASWNTTTSQRDLTWSIPNFTLPSNYDWSYSFDGKIVGRIEVVCMDPDYHDDAINVMYVPSDLYPGVLIYEDQTISSSQPDVRVHELLIMQNDLFLPGSNINLKSGERIDIRDGVTIENGSVTNLIVDPALR